MAAQSNPMPSHVRIFWWLVVAVIAYEFGSAVWYLLFPTPHHLAILARLPPEFREPERRAEFQALIISFFVKSAILLLAWFAAFRRKNWARFAFAFVVLLITLIPLAIAIMYHESDWFQGYPHGSWSDIRYHLGTMLIVTAIIVIFTGNARPWFRSHP
jgi:magnesium-transporting ATPase (P-type)